MNFEKYADREMLALELAPLLATQLEQVLDLKERATFCVPGGTTPAPVFESLCAIDLDWSRVDVLPGDERWVPADSARSNMGMIRRHLLREQATAARLMPLYMAGKTPQQALPDLSLALAPHLPIDVLLLGMGADMHIASLFPGAQGLAEALAPDAPLLAVMHPPGQDEARVTLTAPPLRGAVEIHILITGEEKRAAIGRAAEIDDPLRAPICTVLDQATVHWAP